MDEGSPQKYCDPCRSVYERQTKHVSGFCIQCIEYLCDMCLVHHRKLKASRSHVLLTGEDIPDNKATFQMLEIVGRCSEHKEEEVIFECKDHEEFLCILCAKDKHLKCKGLVEISISSQNETYLTKLTQTHNKLIKDGDKIKELKKETDKKAEKMAKQREEIQEKQQWIRMRLENALKVLKNQECLVEKSFTTHLKKLDSNQKRLMTLYNQNKLSSQFVQALNKYGKPHQIYIAVHGQFNDIDDDMRAVTEELGRLTGVNQDEFHIDADILNLLLTVEGSRGLCENSSDSIDYENDIENLPLVTVKPSILSQTKTVCEPLDEVKSSKVKEKHSRTMLERPLYMETSISVQCTGDNSICDVVGVAMIEALGLIVLADYANKSLKLFDSSFAFLDKKPLADKPCSICVLKGGRVAVLFVEKAIAIFHVSRDAIKHLCMFNIDQYGHSLTTYGNRLAVLCLKTKFDGKETLQVPVTILIVNQSNGDVVKQLDKFFIKSREEKKDLWFEDPCQIYSRYDTELIICTQESIKNVNSNGIQRWYYGRGGLLRRVTGVTSDHEENLYVCGHDSNNVHQIFSMSYNYSRVIIPDVQRPWAIAFDKTGERLLVTSRHSNSVMTYKFL